MTRANSSKTTPKGRTRKAASPANATAGDRPLKIGEAARAVGVEPYVLRFWETQFPILRPRHSRSKHRFYESRDIDTLKLIKRLLHTEGFTIAGAKKHIRAVGLERLRAGISGQEPVSPIVNGGPEAPAEAGGAVQRTLAQIRDDLISLRKLLDGNDPG